MQKNQNSREDTRMTSKTNSNETIEITVPGERQNDICQADIADLYEYDDSFEMDCNEDVKSFGSFYEKKPPIVDCFGARDFEN